MALGRRAPKTCTEFALRCCRLVGPMTRPSPCWRPRTGRRPSRGRTMSVATWTTERIEQLRHCVVTGLTCSQIAAEIGVTRNAVIGKIHRLGLSSGRPAGAQALGCPPRARRPRAPTQHRLLRLAYAQTADGGEAIMFDTSV